MTTADQPLWESVVPSERGRETLLEQATEREDVGDSYGAVEALRAANAIRRDAEVERRLVHLRSKAFYSLESSVTPEVWPPELPDPFPDGPEPPEARTEELTSELLGGAIVHHGSLIVRGLLALDRAAQLVEDVDSAFTAHDAWVQDPDSGVDPAWFSQFEGAGRDRLDARRALVRRGGAVWIAESPRVCFDILEVFAAAGLRELFGGYLGEAAVLSINKLTMRKVHPGGAATWHQDGAFLGDDVRALNVWVALTACGPGIAAPALDLVAGRVEEILPTDGLATSSISNETVKARVGEAHLVQPSFAAGDALIFDERLVHRTGNLRELTEVRYAIESWFFGASHYPKRYVPLVL